MNLTNPRHLSFSLVFSILQMAELFLLTKSELISPRV